MHQNLFSSLAGRGSIGKVEAHHSLRRISTPPFGLGPPLPHLTKSRQATTSSNDRFWDLKPSKTWDLAKIFAPTQLLISKKMGRNQRKMAQICELWGIWRCGAPPKHRAWFHVPHQGWEGSRTQLSFAFKPDDYRTHSNCQLRVSSIFRQTCITATTTLDGAGGTYATVVP